MARHGNLLTEDDVALAARLARVPPELALAIWQQESASGRNTKTSPRGAVGGFQLKPSTFKELIPNGDINDPVDNMQAGLMYLRKGLDKSGGDNEGAAQFYYHGSILPPGVEGPDSGPGTPTTRRYGKDVAARARSIALSRNDTSSSPTPSINTLATAPSSSTYTAGQDEPEVGPDLFGNDESEGNDLTAEYQQEDDTGGDIPQIAGLTQPLNSSSYMMGGSLDGMMNQMGSKDYELDKYIRSLVDQELKA